MTSEYYITFRSITRAQRGSKLLEMLGIGHSMIRTPKHLAAQGCGYALRLHAADATTAIEALRQNEIFFQRIYRTGEQGAMEEVQV